MAEKNKQRIAPHPVDEILRKRLQFSTQLENFVNRFLFSSVQQEARETKAKSKATATPIIMCH